jgi:two-component system response regulator NreC
VSDEEQTQAEAVPTGPFPTLTERERQVAVALAHGQTNREIAKQLQISIKTIDTHRGHALKKVGVRNNVELAHVAIAKGWIQAVDRSKAA